MIKNPDVINTGNEVADGVITVLLSTTILVGGVIGCFLDNTIPGKKILHSTIFELENKYFRKQIFVFEINFLYFFITLYFKFFFNTGTREERGLIAWGKEMELNFEVLENERTEADYIPSTFDLPFGMKLLRRFESYLNILFHINNDLVIKYVH